MKNICAWCNKKLEDIPATAGNSNNQITHGICKSCKEYFFSKKDNTIDQLLNKLDAPVLVVNDAGDVLLANTQALHMLGKDFTMVKDLRIGTVMECAWARLPEGCGHTVHCVACTIRSNINTTFSTGKSLRRVPAVLHRSNGKIHQADFLISTEKVDDMVLLRIDDAFDSKAVDLPV